VGYVKTCKNLFVAGGCAQPHIVQLATRRTPIRLGIQQRVQRLLRRTANHATQNAPRCGLHQSESLGSDFALVHLTSVSGIARPFARVPQLKCAKNSTRYPGLQGELTAVKQV